MNFEKKFGKAALRGVAIGHLFVAAALWRMNGIYTERIYTTGDAELTQFIANGYAAASIGTLLTGLIIFASLRLIKGKAKHRA